MLVILAAATFSDFSRFALVDFFCGSFNNILLRSAVFTFLFYFIIFLFLSIYTIFIKNNPKWTYPWLCCLMFDLYETRFLWLECFLPFFLQPSDLNYIFESIGLTGKNTEPVKMWDVVSVCGMKTSGKNVVQLIQQGKLSSFSSSFDIYTTKIVLLKKTF